MAKKKSFIVLGKYLKEKRLAASLSQGRVAKILGYTSPQFISNCERGICQMPLKNLKQLIELYGIHPDEMTQVLLAMQKDMLSDFFSSSKGRKKVSPASLGSR